MEEADFHDYFLTGYQVDCEKREIRLQSQYGYTKNVPRTEIIFRGVAAYHFYYDNFGTILGWIIEHPLKEFLEQHSEEFALGWQKSGWPPFWRGSAPNWQGSAEDSLGKLEADSVHAWTLESAAGGLDGWVLASATETRELPRLIDPTDDSVG